MFPGMFLQCLLDHFAFERLTRLLEGGAWWRIPRLSQIEILNGETLPLAHDHRASHSVLQLAHVARPRVLLDGVDRLGTEGKAGLPALGGELLQKGLGQQVDVISPDPAAAAI